MSAPISAANPQVMPAQCPLLSVVVPTFNERDNVAELVRRLEITLKGIAWEVIFVDDNSPDKTHAAVKALARKNPRVRCLRRIGRRGLAGACVEGILSSAAPYVAVMDGDLQHDEAILPKMLEKLRDDACDLVVGSRHVAGGSANEGFTPIRAAISTGATLVAQRILRAKVNDVMSGFFMLRRDVVEETAPHLCPEGFKILADLLASSPQPLRVAEEAYTFRTRLAGESKLDTKIALDFLGLMANKMSGGIIPVSFITFGLVGAAGVGLHMAVLWMMMGLGLAFEPAQILATIGAMTFNFFANNAATYRDRALRGRKLLGGLLAFYAVCSIGAVANVGVASWLYSWQPIWWAAALCGIVMGSVWNYALSSLFVWRKK